MSCNYVRGGVGIGSSGLREDMLVEVCAQYGRLQFYEIDALEYDATRYLLAMVLPVCAWILEVDLQLVLLFKPRSKPSR